MKELLKCMEYIKDICPKKKVHHKLKDILVIVLFATLANTNNWVEIVKFTKKEFP